VDEAKLFLFPLIDMADQRPPQTAKESKGFRNRLKKVFGRESQSMPPTVVASDLAPTVSAITTDPEEAARLRAKYTHFRILVIGRANAGKTTLLKRVCNTKEDPVYTKVRISASLDTSLLSSLHRQINPTSKVPTRDLSAFL